MHKIDSRKLQKHENSHLFNKVFERLLSTLKHYEFEATRGYCEFLVYTCLAVSNKIPFVNIMALSFEKLYDLAIKYPVYKEVASSLFRNILDYFNKIIKYCFSSKERIQNILTKIILDLQHLEGEAALTRSRDFFATGNFKNAENSKALSQ